MFVLMVPGPAGVTDAVDRGVRGRAGRRSSSDPIDQFRDASLISSRKVAATYTPATMPSSS
jgi:hypothetical protein